MNRFVPFALGAALMLAACGTTNDAQPQAAMPVTAAHTQPAPTLQPDAFDAPAPSAVAEAQKAAGGEHVGHTHASGPNQSTDEQALYVCPMHPEVTSATPGTCPKCGMTLVPKAPRKEP